VVIKNYWIIGAAITVTALGINYLSPLSETTKDGHDVESFVVAEIVEESVKPTPVTSTRTYPKEAEVTALNYYSFDSVMAHYNQASLDLLAEFKNNEVLAENPGTAAESNYKLLTLTRRCTGLPRLPIKSQTDLDLNIATSRLNTTDKLDRWVERQMTAVATCHHLAEYLGVSLVRGGDLVDKYLGAAAKAGHPIAQMSSLSRDVEGEALTYRDAVLTRGYRHTAKNWEERARFFSSLTTIYRADMVERYMDTTVLAMILLQLEAELMDKGNSFQDAQAEIDSRLLDESLQPEIDKVKTEIARLKGHIETDDWSFLDADDKS
jgi:hypothetical protein